MCGCCYSEAFILLHERLTCMKWSEEGHFVKWKSVRIFWRTCSWGVDMLNWVWFDWSSVSGEICHLWPFKAKARKEFLGFVLLLLQALMKCGPLVNEMCAYTVHCNFSLNIQAQMLPWMKYNQTGYTYSTSKTFVCFYMWFKFVNLNSMSWIWSDIPLWYIYLM